MNDKMIGILLISAFVSIAIAMPTVNGIPDIGTNAFYGFVVLEAFLWSMTGLCAGIVLHLVCRCYKTPDGIHG